jgi:hypothetical protein
VGLNNTSQTSAARSHGVTTRIRRLDHRSMKTPVNGPTIEKGSDTTSVAIANPIAVLARSGEKTTEATSAAWNSPSAN